jgi:hypothetical protein
LLLLLLLLSAAGVVATRRRSAPAAGLALDPPTWPPLPPHPEPPSGETNTADQPTWQPMLDDGTNPEGFAIRAKDSSKIFHVPGGRFYERTSPDRCYAVAADAEADGYRQSKS